MSARELPVQVRQPFFRPTKVVGEVDGSVEKTASVMLEPDLPQARIAAVTARREEMEKTIVGDKLDPEQETGPVADALREAELEILEMRVRKGRLGQLFKDAIVNAPPEIVLEKTGLSGFEYLEEGRGGKGPWQTIITRVVTNPEHPMGDGRPMPIRRRAGEKRKRTTF